MSIITESLFKGEYKVTKDCFNQLSNYIEKYEKHYLLKLLGAELYALFIADLTVTDPQTTQTARFNAIFNPFETDEGNCLIVSEGIKQMLVQLIYFHITRDSLNIKTNIGVVNMVADNSSNAGYNGYNLIESFNQGVKNFSAIQWFICDSTDYPEENSQHLNYINGI